MKNAKRLITICCCSALVIFISRSRRFMAQSASTNTEKKLIQIDISSDTVCPWCFVGKKNLEKALASSSKDCFGDQVAPVFLNPSAPKEGVIKKDLYNEIFGW